MKKFRGIAKRDPFKIIKIITNLINHKIASRNINRFPQLCVYTFDHIGMSINIEGRFESESLDLIKKFLMQSSKFEFNGCAVDIGANIGNHSVFFSELFNKVYSFEPNPKTFKLLKINADKDNIEVRNFGISNKEGILDFYVDQFNLGGSQIIDEKLKKNYKECNLIKIQVKCLDDFENLLNEKISLIKIDVEGHEKNVLEGALQVLNKNLPTIIFEQEAKEIINGSSETIKFLQNLNYIFFTIQNNFDFGNNKIFKLFSFFLRSLFGFRKDLVKVKFFKKKRYETILAVPKYFY